MGALDCGLCRWDAMGGASEAEIEGWAGGDMGGDGYRPAGSAYSPVDESSTAIRDMLGWDEG